MQIGVTSDAANWWQFLLRKQRGEAVKNEATIEQIQNDYDWQEVFGEGTGGNCTQEVDSHDGTATDPVLRANVVEVLASVNGENDGDSWICIVRLNDGRLACCEGSCDYTGWDCSANNTITVASSFASLIESGVTPEWCRRLDIKHPSES